MNPHETLEKLRLDWMKTGDDSELTKFVETEAYHGMSYLEQNRGFITASKIRLFSEDQWTFKLKYVDEMPEPYAVDTTYKPFAIGSGFDDLVTYGEEAFDRHFAIMDISVSDIDQAINDCQCRIAEAQADLKKDGTRSKPGIAAEMKAMERIGFLNSIRGKTQLTKSDYELILQMWQEWHQNMTPGWGRKPNKRTVFFKFGKIPCKAELDDYEPHFTNEYLSASDFRCIIDVKTCQDIKTFKPDSYIPQLAWYQLAVEEVEPEDTRPTCGVIEAVDKHSLWSRSQAYYFSPERLRDARGSLLTKCSELWDSIETGMFFRTKEPMFDSKYYGVDGYGRPTQFVIV